MMESEREKWRWRWAYSELIKHLCAHDAKWIDEAKNKWKPETFDAFLKPYSLQRLFPRNGNSFINREEFVQICHCIFKDDLPDPKIDGHQALAKKAQCKWNEAIRRLNSKFSKNFKSATLKMFWFYHPDKLTMYDKLAHDGLQCEARQLGLRRIKVDTDKPQENFLEIFYEYFEKKECKRLIENARKSCNENHNVRLEKRYDYRVADHYLWLAGSGEEFEKLEKFKKEWESKSKG